MIRFKTQKKEHDRCLSSFEKMLQGDAGSTQHAASCYRVRRLVKYYSARLSYSSSHHHIIISI
jgi:hypothetical protein